MPITAALTITQGADKTKATITDTTPYGGGEPRAGFTARTLTLYKSDGTTFGTYNFSYTTYPSDTIEITGLDKDYCLTASMVITPSVVVSGSVYTAQAIKALTGFTMEYFYDRMRQVVLQPRLEKNQAYNLDTYKILMLSDTAVQAGVNGDPEGAQLALDLAARIELYNPKPY